MSDPTQPAALPATRPAARRGALTRAQRLAVQAEAMASATDTARRVLDASFGTVPGPDCTPPAPKREPEPAGLCVHVTCDVEETHREAPRVAAPARAIDIAVTVRVVAPRTASRQTLPDVQAA